MNYFSLEMENQKHQMLQHPDENIFTILTHAISLVATRDKLTMSIYFRI